MRPSSPSEIADSASSIVAHPFKINFPFHLSLIGAIFSGFNLPENVLFMKSPSCPIFNPLGMYGLSVAKLGVPCINVFNAQDGLPIICKTLFMLILGGIANPFLMSLGLNPKEGTSQSNTSTSYPDFSKRVIISSLNSFSAGW